MNKTFKTKKGTEIPIINLKGKDYLEVKYRISWMREEHPDWGIMTEFVERNDKFAIAKATIYNDKNMIIATSHKREDIAHFPDNLEKAETGAIGRALALCGYGTQFADDLSEGERIVDAPVARPQAARRAGGEMTITSRTLSPQEKDHILANIKPNPNAVPAPKIPIRGRPGDEPTLDGQFEAF